MIKIDSADRTSGSSSNFTIIFKDGVEALEGKYNINMLSVPVSWYNVYSGNNIIPLFINGGLSLVNIPIGYYDINSLLPALKTSLESVSGGAVFTITFDDVSKKLKITTDRNFEFRFSDTLTGSANNLLGFANSTIVSVGNSVTGTYIPNLNPIDTLAIVFRGVQDSINMTNGQSCTVLVPINAQWGSLNVIEFKNPHSLSFPNKVKTLDVSVNDARTGKPVDLLGLNWWVVFKKV